MTNQNQQAKYELLEENNSLSNNFTWLRLCMLMTLCTLSTLLVFTTWSAIYRQSLNLPPKLTDVPPLWYQRAEIYSIHTSPFNYHKTFNYSLNNAINEQLLNNFEQSTTVKQIDNERIYPSKLGNFIYHQKNDDTKKKLVCYYSSPNSRYKYRNIQLKDIDPFLCTHINIGMVDIVENRLHLSDEVKKTLNDTNILKIKNRNIKILLCAGGANVGGFSEMIKNHANRKIFIQSIKSVLETYRLDGIDLDWEFPSAYNKERQHFSQLLHEIRREYQREHRTYLLSVAVAAPEGIAFFAYDFQEIQNYCDYINLMSYDFHFYSKNTPFTGINSPLYPRQNEQSILSTLNINYTANKWHLNGVDKNKIIIGLPTYGHSFRLVNPFNNGIGSPAEDNGSVGEEGFVSYSEICWFKQNNIYVNNVFDKETCSPYLYSALEWISYENEESLECKTKYIIDNNFGGAMIFSLNMDDHGLHCRPSKETQNNNKVKYFNGSEAFPLIRKVHSILFDKFK